MFKILTASLLGLLLIGCGNSDGTGSPKPKKPKTETEIQGLNFLVCLAV